MKVRITKVPQARTGYQVQGSLANDVPAMGGADYNTYTGEPKLKANKYITAVPREEANLEAEGGETVYGDINGDGMAEHKTIKGPRHSGGGVPLNLPDDTFIYSDFRGMNIKEPEILTMFGKGGNGKKSYTPADLAKQYDIERYRKILEDPDSDKIDKKTAELMIKNYQNKLGLLALVQEAEKGFPQGVAAVSKPTMTTNGYKEDDFMDPTVKQFGEQIEGKIAQSETANSEPDMENGFEDQAMLAQEMNQGEPIAAPMAQFGMTMGGFDVPYTDTETGDFLKQAQYGMPMGVNSGNYAGRPHYQRGGDLNQYQTKGAVKEEAIDITGMTPAQAKRARWDYFEKNGKDAPEPTFIKDGKKHLYKQPGAPTQAKSLDDVKKIHAAQEQLLENELKNNPQVRAELIKKTRESLKDPNAYGSGKNSITYKTYSKLDDKTLTDDQIIQYAVTQVKRNNRIKELDVNIGVFRNDGNGFDTPSNIVRRGLAANPAEAQKLINEYKAKKWTSVNAVTRLTGEKIPDAKTVAIEQATTHGYARMHQDLAGGKYTDPEQKYSMTSFLGTPSNRLNTGAGDESQMSGVFGSDFATISPIDGVRGNTTGAHGIGINENTGDFELAPLGMKKCPCDQPDVPEDKECAPCPEENEDPGEIPRPPLEDKFWLQDEIKTAGAVANLMGIKKHMPISTRVDLQTPKATFLDPTRALAANAEQANIQTNALAQFTGAQGLSARSSSVQGQAAKNAAELMANYNNQNVNIANQFETNIANINNQEQAMNQAAQSKLYDQNTMANQQFENSVRGARNQLVNQSANAITNKQKTAALNRLYPNYRVRPEDGGSPDFVPGSKIKPGAGSADYMYYLDDCLSRGLTGDAAVNCAKAQAKSSGGGQDNRGLEAYQAQYGQEGGFIYGDHTYPFIH